MTTVTKEDVDKAEAAWEAAWKAAAAADYDDYAAAVDAWLKYTKLKREYEYETQQQLTETP